MAKLQNLQKRVEEFQVEVVQEVAKRRPGGSVKADFAQFPSKEMTKALHESKPEVIGRITIPVTGEQVVNTPCVPLVLNIETLRLLHKKLLL
jgi:hypothetical protein